MTDKICKWCKKEKRPRGPMVHFYQLITGVFCSVWACKGCGYFETQPIPATGESKETK